MLFNYRFSGNTTVTSTLYQTGLSFSPDTYRDGAWFIGKLNKRLPFREAISALHDVVVSDMRFKPRDKSDYKEWADKNEALFLAQYMAAYDAKAAVDRIGAIRAELTQIQDQSSKILAPYYSARQRYFNY